MVEGIRANGRENQDLHASRDIATQRSSSIDGKMHTRPTALYERCAGRHSHTQGPYPTIPFEHILSKTSRRCQHLRLTRTSNSLHILGTYIVPVLRNHNTRNKSAMSRQRHMSKGCQTYKKYNNET